MCGTHGLQFMGPAAKASSADLGLSLKFSSKFMFGHLLAYPPPFFFGLGCLWLSVESFGWRVAGKAVMSNRLMALLPCPGRFSLQSIHEMNR